MVFVTGGTGLLGSHLLVELTKQHDTITAIYRDKDKIKTVKACFKYYLKKDYKDYFKKIKWEECDLLDIPRLEDKMKGHKIVYHCAAIVSFARQDFHKMMEINRYGTANVVNIALDFGVEKLCYVSSTAAVGNKDIPSHEEITENGKWVLTDETSGYSIAKYSAEKEVWRAIQEGLNAVIVNPSVIIGAGDWDESSMRIFKTIKKGMPFYSPGANSFVDARDVSKIMVELMNKETFGERFLLTGANETFKNFFQLIAEKLDKKPAKLKLSKFVMGLTWRLSVAWAFITFSKPSITKEVARSSFNVSKYSNAKITKTLNHTFYDLEEMVENAIKGRLD